MRLLIGLGGVALLACAASETELQNKTAEIEKCEADLQRARRVKGQHETEVEGHLKKATAQILELQQKQEVFTRGFKNDPHVLDKLLGLLAASVRRSEEWKAMSTRLKPAVDGGKVRLLVERSMVVVRLDSAALWGGKGDARLDKAGEGLLDDVAAALRELPDREFLVADRGTIDAPSGDKGKRAPSSFERSAARAAAVAAHLRQRGVQPDRLSIAGGSEFGALAGGSGAHVDVWLLPRGDELAPLDRK